MSFRRTEDPLPRKTHTKVCPGCGVLLDASEKRCFQCGSAVSSATMSGARLWVKRNVQLQGEVTFGIIIVNFVLFFLTWFMSRTKSGPVMDIDIEVLNHFGAKNTLLILKGEVWRLVTATFLHGNLMHIAFNMMALYSLGRLVEELYGWERYLFFYVVTGIVGYLASLWFYPDVLSLGASGAIMGLAGVLIATSVKNWKTYGALMGKSLMRWVVYVLLIGFFLRGYVDNAAHVGGLVSGFLIALPFSSSPWKTKSSFETLLGWGSVLIIFGSFFAFALHP